MSKYAVVDEVEIPAGFKPKYLDNQGQVLKTVPAEGELYIRETYRIGEIHKCVGMLSKPRVVVEKEKTYAEKMKEWWPHYLTAAYAATDVYGTYFFTDCPEFDGELWEPAAADSYVIHGRDLQVFMCGEPPKFAGHYEDSLIRNPHLF